MPHVDILYYPQMQVYKIIKRPINLQMIFHIFWPRLVNIYYRGIPCFAAVCILHGFIVRRYKNRGHQAMSPIFNDK